jgi:hypothetical protein
LVALKTEVARRWPMTSLLDILKESDLRIGFYRRFSECAEHLTIAAADRAVGASGPGQPLIALDQPPEAAHPPAFVLFTLLWLIAPLAAALHRLDPVVTQPQPPSHAARQTTASASTSVEWLASFDATHTTRSAATALAIASPEKPCAPPHRPAEQTRRPRSRAPT